MEIRGKTALVTGGTDGIGLEAARELKRRGAHVIVCGRRQDRLDAAAAEGLEALPADLSHAEGVDGLVAAVARRGIDILINNAGASADFNVAANPDVEGADRCIFLNLNAPVRIAAAMVPALRARPQAALVNVTSGLAIAPRGGGPVYCATKAGLRSFTKAIRYQLKDSNVRVIEALPPVVETAMTASRSGRKMSAADCGKAIVDAVARDRNEANIGLVRVLKIVHSISPRLAEAIMIRF
jgi:uncharacterized oxidoreductase